MHGRQHIFRCALILCFVSAGYFFVSGAAAFALSVAVNTPRSVAAQKNMTRWVEPAGSGAVVAACASSPSQSTACTGNNSASITLSWADASGIDAILAYIGYRRTDSAATTEIRDLPTFGTYTITGLTPSTSYSWAIRVQRRVGTICDFPCDITDPDTGITTTYWGHEIAVGTTVTAGPATYGAACSSPGNSCGDTTPGTITCFGTCSATAAPPERAGWGSACTGTANACGVANSGTMTVCSGSGLACSASARPNPAEYGNACTSPANACGMTNSGTLTCSGGSESLYCSASTPPNSSCPNATGDIKANGADSLSINNGDSATISWTSTNASSCSVSPTGWTGTSNGGISTGALTSAVTYTLTCTGVNGTTLAVDSVTVSIACNDIGLRIQEAGGTVVINTHPSSPLKISKNGTTYGISLVPITHSRATSLRIETLSGIMAAERCP